LTYIKDGPCSLEEKHPEYIGHICLIPQHPSLIPEADINCPMGKMVLCEKSYITLKFSWILFSWLIFYEKIGNRRGESKPAASQVK
jgi:hypothetical protein